MKYLRAVVAIIVFFVAAHSAARADVTGTWTLSASSQNEVQLDLRYEHGNDSSSIRLSDLSGLSWQQIASSGGLHFTLTREAATLTFTGTASNGHAGGTFTLAPNAGYRAKMASLGFTSISDQDLIAATMLDITTAYTQSIVAEGYTGSSFSDLIPLRALDVNADYIRQMRSVVSAHDVPFHDLIPLRALHIDAAYVSGLAADGYSNLRTDQLIELKSMGIDRAYIAKVKAHGIKHATIDDLVRLKSMDII